MASNFDQQLERMRSADGFIAALDQSGGSTPKALQAYGVEPSAYSNEDEMFDCVHAMRTRIVTNSAFTSNRILGVILFEQTMERQVEGLQTPEYLWSQKNIVPFLKIDKGLADSVDGVKLMKPIPELGKSLERAKALGVFGTKMRSVIEAANADAIEAIVAQQFELAGEILAHGLVPIVEPEVDINRADKQGCEDLLVASLARHLDALPEGQQVIFKLTLPSAANHYQQFVGHPRVARLVALSGGYSREDANTMLAQNSGMVASFSRALAEGLSAGQSDDEFTATLDTSIQAIFEASCAG